MPTDRCPICRQPGREPGIPHKLDCPRARYHLTLPATGPAPARASTEAEREARIRADERARIVARIRRGAANPWAPAPDRHAWERLADLIEKETSDDH